MDMLFSCHSEFVRDWWTETRCVTSHVYSRWQTDNIPMPSKLTWRHLLTRSIFWTVASHVILERKPSPTLPQTGPSCVFFNQLTAKKNKVSRCDWNQLGKQLHHRAEVEEKIANYQINLPSGKNVPGEQFSGLTPLHIYVDFQSLLHIT